MMPMMMRQFNLLRPIAEGGMGIVYRAFDTTLEREVAVKLMKAELADDKEVLEGFYRESARVRLPESYQHHPYLRLRRTRRNALPCDGGR